MSVGAGEAVETLTGVIGTMAAAAVDLESGRCLASALAHAAPDGMDLPRAARHNAGVLRAHLEAAASMELDDEIEDVLMTMGRQYHLVRFVPRLDCAGLFLYLIADRNQINLAHARRELAVAAAGLELTADERERLSALRCAHRQETQDAEDSRREDGPVRRERVTPPLPSKFWDNDEYEGVPEDELPPFMRTDAVLRLLGIAPNAAGTAGAQSPAASS
jgi:hypothetical protein